MNQSIATKESSDVLFVISREFDAPVERMYRAWTEEDRLNAWWGPEGFELRRGVLDFCRGGIFHYCLRDPGGVEMWGKWVITQILPGRRLDFIVAFCDENAGEPVRHPYEPDWPLEVSTEVIFSPSDAGTRVEVRWVPLNASEAERRTFAAGRDACRTGWTGTFDRLEGYLLEEGRRDS